MAYSIPNIEQYDTLLLDRDGTINVLRPADYVKTWEEFVFLPAFIDAIPHWAKHFRHILIVTNQRGVGRGKMTEQALLDVHARMCRAIEAHGGRIDHIYYCTAISETDPMRKPQTGMWEQIITDYPDIQPEKTIMVGDGACDEQFAHNIGIDFLRV